MSKYSKKPKQSQSQLTLHASKLEQLGYAIIPIAEGLKHPNRANWQRMDIDVPSWEQDDAYTGVGVCTRDTPAVDVDVQVEDLADKVLSFTRELLGDTICRIGMAPKSLLFYRTDKPFKKLASAKYSSPDGLEHRVEILADGQQAVAYHVHPDTHAPYYYDGDELTSVAAADLPTITLAQAREVVEFFESIVPADWMSILPRSGFGQGADLAVVSGGLSRWDKLADDTKDAELGKVLTVLIGDVCDERDSWKDVVAMCVRSGAPHRRDVCQAWSRTSDKYDDAGFESVWQSYNAKAVAGDLTMGSLMYMAGSAGWVAPWSSSNTAAMAEAGSAISGLLVNTELSVFEGQPAVASSSLLDRYVYMRAFDVFYDLDKLTPISRSGVNTVHGSEVFNARTGQRCKAATWMEQQYKLQVGDGYTWLPAPYTEPVQEMVDHGGQRLVNTWRGFQLTPAAGDVSMWLDLVEHLIPGTEDREVYLDRMAFDVQYPHIKCSWHVVMLGVHGAGKECVLAPLFSMFGNAAITLGNEDIKGGWDDGFVGRKVIVVSEVRGLGGDAMEKMKRKAASASNALALLNPKGEKQIEHPNLWSFFFITNYRDAMHLHVNERRWFCVEAKNKMPEDMIARYFPWAEQPGSYEAVIAYLMGRDLSEFSVASVPYRTTTFYDMCDIAKHDHEQLLSQWMDDGTNGFNYGIVMPSTLRDKLSAHKVRASLAYIKQWLRDNDYTPYPSQIQRKMPDGLVQSKSRSYHISAAMRGKEKHEIFDVIDDIEGQFSYPTKG